MSWDFQYLVNRSGERQHPYFVPNLTVKVFSFSPSSMMFAVGHFVDILYRDEKVPLYFQFAETFFYHEWMLVLSNAFYASIVMIM